MDKYRQSQIELLVRTGLMPVQYLPLLNRAFSYMSQDAFIPVLNRKIFYDFVEKLMDLTLNDPMIYRLIRQRVGMGKYEEVSEEEMDLKRTPDGMLDQLASSVKGKKRAGGHTSPAETRLASKAKAELRRRRDNKRGREETREEVEQVAELSNETLKSFLKKAKTSGKRSFRKAETHEFKSFDAEAYKKDKKTAKKHADLADAHYKKAEKREKGISTATTKLANENYEKAFLDVLKSYNVMSVADLPKENVKEFFNTVEQLYKSGE
jgi:hypothetical protein